MNAIVSVTREWGIGRDGHLPVRNRADMRRFVRLTMGGTVVMGRKTFETFPGGPLKGRRNIVMTRDDGYRREGVERVASPKGPFRSSRRKNPTRSGSSAERQCITPCSPPARASTSL